MADAQGVLPRGLPGAFEVFATLVDDLGKVEDEPKGFDTTESFRDWKDGLDPLTLRALNLCFFEGMNLEQVSDEVGRPSEELRRLLSEALIRLRSYASLNSDVQVLAARAASALGSAEAGLAWVDSPNRAMGGVTPREALATENGAERTLKVLERLEDGIFS